MYGAILGDIIGSPYEFDQGDKTKEFPLFTDLSMFTDDSIMTLAVAEALMDSLEKSEEPEKTRKRLIRYMQFWGEKYPNAGYGARFSWWLMTGSTQPYNSYGNGSAMRVSSVGWLYDDLDTVLQMAKLSAEVTHNHPEGIKGAQATAAAIFLARTGYTKAEIKEYTEILFGYDLNRTCDEIRPTYCHKESCQETVPEAIIAFLESTDFEDAIRNAVSLGGDCDTLTCITGSITEAFYGVPEELKQKCRTRLPDELEAILLRFEKFLAEKQKKSIDMD